MTRKDIQENSQYAVLALIVAGQSIGDPMMSGAAFVSANSLATWRCFALGRPTADKIKDAVLLSSSVLGIALKILT
jgi:hypothetical protein